jgi:alpha-D-ribose 1-methylphosphonate 5-triphosphate synthase subunit PhnG
MIVSSTASTDPAPTDRRAVMALFAQASSVELSHVLAAFGDLPDADDIRSADIGLAMVRGRIGGDGKPFNVGEASVTRAAIRLADGTVGICYRLGRDVALARRLAIVDALVQQTAQGARIRHAILDPLRDLVARRHAREAAETAATRVDFFTMVRGESAA